MIKNSKNIAIIGGGPSGLMAAEIIAAAGHRVTIYDSMPSMGRKFLLAGRGGLNLTHSEEIEKFITRYFEAATWLAPIIKNFDPQKLRKWCEDLGEETFVGTSGRVFPKSMKASPLLRAWFKKLESLGVQYRVRHLWQGFDGEDLVFRDADENFSSLSLQDKETQHELRPALRGSPSLMSTGHKGNIIKVKADATLLALGGASWPHLGSNGSWVNILTEYGVKISDLRPSNCGFVSDWSDFLATKFAGTPLKSIAIRHQNLVHKGEMVLTKKGIEGNAVYALSASLREAIAKEGKTILFVDLRPEMNNSELAKKLKSRGKESLSNYLRKAGFPSVVSALLNEVIPPQELVKATPEILANYLKNLPITLTATTNIDRAISTAGGIAWESLTENLMLKNKAGVFVAGEMIDWEAPTGGYLLQACFSTAVAAANGVLQFVK